MVMRGVNDDEVADFVELTRHAPINVRFIEYMPFDGNAWGSKKMVPYRELMAAVNSRCGELMLCVCLGGINVDQQGFCTIGHLMLTTLVSVEHCFPQQLAVNNTFVPSQ